MAPSPKKHTAIDQIPDGGTVAIPIDEAGRYLINYRYGKMETEADFGRAFTTIEYFDLLLALHQKKAEFQNVSVS